MNVLFLTPYLPYPPNSGGKIRTLNLIKTISKYHKVSLLSLVQHDETKYISDLEKYCDVNTLPLKIQKHGRVKSFFSIYPYVTMSKYYSLENQKQIHNFISNNDFDIIQVESLLMSAYVQNISIPKVFDAHNIESDILYRTFTTSKFKVKSVLNFVDYLKNIMYEKSAIKSFNACLSVSEIDRKRLLAMGAQRVKTLPNCVDLNYFHKIERNDFCPRIIFTGYMSWFPNVDAIDFFCKKAYPTLKKLIPDIKFDVVGRDPKQTIQKLNEDSDILITGEVPDVRPFISNSDVCIVPLRIGGGTRLKILEYFAMGIPVISTSVGVEGIDAINGEHLIIEDDISKFPNRIIELLNDQEFAKYLAKNGRKLVEEKYSWSQYGENLNQLYFDILKHR